MSGAVVEMYIKNQIEHSIGLGRLSKLLIYWIVANLPNIKDIHLTALGKNKHHITSLFNDCSRVHWWYNHEQTFMLPDYFQGLRSDGTNYQAKTFMESTTKVPATNVTYKIYLLNHLYDEMKKNAKLYRDVKDLDEYVGDSLPLLSSQELNPYGSCIEDVVRTRMFVVDIGINGKAVGEAHGNVFSDIRPVSSMIGVAGLIDTRMLVEIECEAIIGCGK